MQEGRVIKRVVTSVVTSPLFRPLRRPALRGTQFVLGLAQREVVNFAQPSRATAVARVREIVTGFPSQTVGVDEAYIVRCAVIATEQVPGVIAEVGVYRGCTARVICEAKNDRPLYLFDTFEGLPAPGPLDAGFEQGQYACSLESVQTYLAGYHNLHFVPGLFPGTSAVVHDCRFAFVHLDVDLYASTIASLQFFYPRMSRGAMLISHDYVEFPAVHTAFDEYFRGTEQPVLELTGNQCLVVKITD